MEAILEETEAAREEKAGEEKRGRRREKKSAKTASKPTDRKGNGYGRHGSRERKSGTTWGKSDDPNQIYGRFFDDEPIELAQVVSEMGEITCGARSSSLRPGRSVMRRPLSCSR